jgi:thioredoxin 1
MKNSQLVFVQILFLLLSVSCFVIKCKIPRPSELTPQEFNKQISLSPSAIIVDVRTPDEFESGHIKNAINIDFLNNGFSDNIVNLDEKSTFFVYCALGGISQEAVKEMKSKGIKNVYYMEGGLNAWKSSGYEIVQPD